MPSACSARGGVAARPGRRRCPWGRASAPTARPARVPRCGWAVLARVSSPRASARRLAGSMVTTQARRPRRAASRAKAADTVVLPTPPEPQHTTMDALLDQLGQPRPRRRGPVGGSASRCGPVDGWRSRRRVGDASRAPASSRRRHGLVVGQPATAAASSSARQSSSAGPMVSLKRKGACSWGRGSSSASRRALLLLQAEAAGPEGGRRRAGPSAWSAVRVTPTSAAASLGVRARARVRRAGRRSR